MRTVFYSIGLVLLLLIAGKASAELVCYQWSAPFPMERYQLNITTHSLLSEDGAEHKFGHPQQLVFSIFGKHVGTCGGNTVRPVVGTLISTVPVGQPSEARLGLESFNTTGVPNFCRDVEISCTVGNVAGFPPPVLTCFGQNKFGEEFQVQLTKVRAEEDPRCSLFEDDPSSGTATAATVAITAVASGVRQQ
jgi:hypothetical protein